MACAALRQRLLTTLWIWVSSAATKMGAAGRCRATSTRWLIAGRHRSIAAATAAPRSIAARGVGSLRLKVRISLASWRPRLPALSTRPSGARAALSGGRCSSATSVEVKMVARMLLKSWATPLASVPTAFSFSAWRSSASSKRSRVMSVVSSTSPPSGILASRTRTQRPSARCCSWSLCSSRRIASRRLTKPSPMSGWWIGPRARASRSRSSKRLPRARAARTFSV